MVIAALALAVPMADGAAPAKRYQGSFEPGGTLSFKVKKRNGNKKVVRFKFQAFPLDCSGEPKTTSGYLDFAMRVNRKNRFRAKAIRGTASAPKASLKLRGKLVGARNARGTMQVEGSSVLVDPSGSAACASPRTKWSAKRT